MSEMKIIIDDGRKRVPIESKTGEEIGFFTFSPTDIDIIERYNKVADEFDKVVEPLQDIGIKADGSGVDDASIKALQEAKSRLYSLIDYLFAGNAADAFFGKINPFSPVDGNFYCVNVMNAVSAFISAQFEAETKKISKNLAKYTKRYTK